MSTIDYISATWIVLILLAGVLAKRKEITYPTIKKRNHIFILALEVIFLLVTYYFRNQKVSSPYIIIFATFLLAVGWIISYQRLLLSIFKGQKKRPWLWRINLLIEGSQYPQNVYFSGDWLQIIAIALLWNSPISLFLSLIIYPLIVFILTSSNTKNYNKQVTEKSDLIKNDVWERFTKTIIRNIGRTFAISLFIIIPIAIMSRDWTIFFGTSDNAINLITTLAQVEATVFALVITFLFVFVEFTNTAYSPRLVRSFTKQWSFRLMVFFAIFSIATKFFLMTNIPQYLSEKNTFGENVLIDWALILTVLSVLGYYFFIRDTVNSMQPEAIANQILSKFDWSWMEVVRKNWADQRESERLIFLDDDPMILFERYLATTIERGDSYSIKLALVLMRDRLSQIMNKDDGAILDTYLFNRLGNVIDILARNRFDLGLEILAELVSEITTPSQEVLKASEVGSFDAPPGTQLLRKIAENSIDFQLTNSGRRAIQIINNRGTAIVKALPAYNELWIINPQNHELPQSEIEKLWKNDWRLDNYTRGYFYYFARLGEKATKAKSAEIVWQIMDLIISQINAVLEIIKDEPYQISIIRDALYSLDSIVSSVCSEKLQGGIYFGLISYGKLENVSNNVAQMLSNYYSNFVEKISRAGILEGNIIVDVAIMAFKLKLKHPEVAIQIIETFGNAGEMLVKDRDFFTKEKREYILWEIDRRIDQIKPSVSDKKLNAKITKTVNIAKQKIKAE